jgi:hypothetical protein
MMLMNDHDTVHILIYSKKLKKLLESIRLELIET